MAISQESAKGPSPSPKKKRVRVSTPERVAAKKARKDKNVQEGEEKTQRGGKSPRKEQARPNTPGSPHSCPPHPSGPTLPSQTEEIRESTSHQATGATLYLAVLNNDQHVSILRFITRLQTELRPSKAVKGKLVAFVGENQDGDTTPSLWVLDDEEAATETVLFPMVDRGLVTEYYSGGMYDCDGPPDIRDMVPGRQSGLERRLGRILQIPQEWEDQFSDSPRFEEAIRRLDKLVQDAEPATRMKHAAFSVTLATAVCTYDNEHSEGVYRSAIAISAAQLRNTAAVKACAEEKWNQAIATLVQRRQDNMYGRRSDPRPDKPDAPPETADNDSQAAGSNSNGSTYNEGEDEESTRAESPILSPKPAASNSDSDDSEASSEEDEDPPLARKKPKNREPSTETKAYLEALIKMSTRNLKIALKATNAAAVATGSPTSKLSATRLEWLEACAGHNDAYVQFRPPPVYEELERTGWTKEAVGTALRRRCVEVKGTRYKCRVYVSSKMILTFKNGDFACSNERTHDGCTSGTTPFAVPLLSQKMAHEDSMDHQAFEDATHKTQADNRKFLAGQKFSPPTTLTEVVRVLNNYICWLEVMFGGDCPHLLLVVRLRDALDKNEDTLEPALDRYLRLTILWKVHEDARQFFDRCEKWSRGEPLPTSKLSGMVELLENDQMVYRSITCPFEEFFTEKRDKPGKGGRGGGGLGKGGDEEPKARERKTREPQPTTNPTIPPLCIAAVKKYKAAHPNMTITQFAAESGIPTKRFVIGGRGGCTNYQLLGACSALCNFSHTATTVTDGRQKEVAAALLEGMKAIEAKTNTPQS